MTMFKQVAIIFSVILLFILSLVLTVNFLDTKRFVGDELFFKAQNDATVLSVYMTMAKGDISKIKSIANAVFDDGYYSEITLRDMQGKKIFKKVIKDKPQVSSWFEKIVSIPAIIAKAQVSNGWTPYGILEIKMSTTKSIEYLYQLFEKIVLIFIISYLLGILFIYLLLKFIFKPLKRVQHQAEGVLKNRFEYQKELPSTKELRPVVQAINTMVEKMEDIYKSLQKVTNKNKSIAYFDEVTKLNNRKFFILKYNEYINSNDSRSNGIILFLRVTNTYDANKIIGYDNVNKIYKKIAQILKDTTKDIDESLVCRVSGSEFGSILPAVEEDLIEKVATKIEELFRDSLEQFPEVSDFINIYMVAKDYKKNQSLSTTLSSIDFALNSLQSEEKEHYKCIITERYGIAKSKLRVALQEALKNGYLNPKELLFTPLKGDKEMKFIGFGIKSDEIGEIEYEMLVPTIKYYNLYDEYILQVCKFLSKLLPEQNISIEIDILYFDNLTVVNRIIEQIKMLKMKNINLVIEIPQRDIQKLENIKAATIINKFKENDIDLAISRFDADKKAVEKLYDIHPKYVRMYIEHFLDMGDVLKENIILMLKTAGAKVVLDKVEQESKKSLEHFDIDYITMKLK